MKRIFYAASGIYILFILTVECSALRYLTTWTIITQGLYFLSEFHWNPNMSRLTQNLTFTPSVFLLVYWVLKLHYGWCCNDMKYLLHDLSIHGLNILLVIIAVYIHPKLEYKFVWLPVIMGTAYVAFAVVYTSQHGSIYPTNFFTTDIMILYDMVAVLVIGPAIHFTGTKIAKCKSSKYNMLPVEDTNKKSWCQKKCNFKILY